MASFIVFALCILGFYTGTNIYIAARLAQWLGINGIYTALWMICFMGLALLFAAAELLRDKIPFKLERAANMAGGFYLGAYAVLLIMTPVCDLVFRGRGGPVTALTVILSAVIISAFAINQASRVEIKEYKVRCEKAGKVKIAFISDLHIGRIIREKHINKIVEAVNKTHADYVLIGGDILDTGPGRCVDTEGAARAFSKMKAGKGVYACLGNHDGGFKGREKEAIRVIEKWGIKVLYDEAIQLEGINIAGRKDRGDPSGRKSPKELLSGLEGFTVVLDHRPGELLQEAEAGADLVLCGHTHKGQIFPFNLITAAAYKPNYGEAREGNCTMIVSSGAGTWGPKMRLGSKCEVVSVEITE